MNTTHHPFLDMLDAYVLGTLGAEDVVRLETHLSEDCELCMAELELIVDAPLILAGAASTEQVPASIRNGILSAIDGDSPRIVPIAPRRRWVAWTAAAVAASLVGFLAGVWFGSNEMETAQREWREREAALIAEHDDKQALLTVVFDPSSECVSFNTTAEAPSGLSGRVIVDAARANAVVAVDVASIASDEDYELWAIRDGVPVSLGVIARSGDGLTHVLLHDLTEGGAPSALAVSLEAAGGSTSGSPALVVMVAPL